jgi:hypothetical protein
MAPAPPAAASSHTCVGSLIRPARRSPAPRPHGRRPPRSTGSRPPHGSPAQSATSNANSAPTTPRSTPAEAPGSTRTRRRATAATRPGPGTARHLSGSSQAIAHRGGWSAPRSASAANLAATPWRPGSGSSTASGSTGSSAFCRRSLSFSTPHCGPARTADVVLVSHSKRTEPRAAHDRNKQTTMADRRRQPTPRRPGAVAPAPAWSWRGTR